MEEHYKNLCENDKLGAIGWKAEERLKQRGLSRTDVLFDSETKQVVEPFQLKISKVQLKQMY